MLSNISRNLTLATLSVALISTQFGCSSGARIAAKELAKNPASWAAVAAVASAGTAIRAEARQSDKDSQSGDVLVSLSIPVRLSDGSIAYSNPMYAYVNCRDLGNDSAIIERNHITYDGREPLNQTNQTIVANYIRNAALPQCQKKIGSN